MSRPHSRRSTDFGWSAAEHLAWAKTRALEYLPERPVLAIASITSDLTKHSHTAPHVERVYTALLEHWANESVEDLRRCIEDIAL